MQRVVLIGKADEFIKDLEAKRLLRKAGKKKRTVPKLKTIKIDSFQKRLALPKINSEEERRQAIYRRNKALDEASAEYDMAIMEERRKRAMKPCSVCGSPQYGTECAECNRTRKILRSMTTDALQKVRK